VAAVSGALVGEVIDALEAGSVALTDPEFRALVAIAEKCHADTRQGSVRTARIHAVIGMSESTTERTIRSLKGRGLIRVVKRGSKSHGLFRATLYELLALPSSKVKEAQAGCFPHPDDGSKGVVLPSNSDVLPSNRPCASVIDPPLTCGAAEYDGTYYVSNDGIGDGDARGRAREAATNVVDLWVKSKHRRTQTARTSIVEAVTAALDSGMGEDQIIEVVQSVEGKSPPALLVSRLAQAAARTAR
jgi:DNA-binding MarR family transcriptional regulator